MILKVVVLALILSSKAIVLFTQPKINDVKLENIISLSKPENYDKYASIAVDAQNNTWVSFTSMQNEKEKIIVTLKNNIGWWWITTSSKPFHVMNQISQGTLSSRNSGQ